MFEKTTLWEVIKTGGPVMYFLILCSVGSVAAIIDRAMHYHRRSRVSRQAFMKSVMPCLEKGDIKNAMTVAKNTSTPFADVVVAGLNAASLDEKEIVAALDRQIIIETRDLEKYTAILGTVGSTAVYIGLLGTVGGIIKTFQDISRVGSGGINVVIGGISEALVCTAAGLLVAIPAVIAYNYFVKKMNEFVSDMELCASEIMGPLNVRKR